jgi:hypothetical protein
MDSWILAVVLKPLLFLAVCFMALDPARKAVERMKDSRLKRLLLKRIQ